MEASSSALSFADQVREAAAVVRERLGTAQIAIVLGSGLSNFASVFDEKQELIYAEIPHMPSTTVTGHAGKLIMGSLNGQKVLCFSGRVHSYEGIPFREVCFSVRLAAALGCRLMVLTNASGGSGQGMFPGCFMLIKDHIKFAKMDPLAELGLEGEFKEYHLNPHDCWSPRMCDIARSSAAKLDIKLFEGTYCWTSGPSFETPSEVVAATTLGASCFGMSTVPEAIAARAAGMEVFGVSVVTNLAAGMSLNKLTHEEVKAEADKSGPRFQSLIKEILSSAAMEIQHDVATRPDSKPVVEVPSAHTSASLAALLASNTNRAYSAAEISAATKFVSERLGALGASAAIVTSGQDAILSNLQKKRQLLLSDIPSFAPCSISGLSGCIVTGELDGARTTVVVAPELQGFSASESAFIAAVLSQLSVERILLGVIGLPINGEAGAPVVPVGDALNNTLQKPLDTLAHLIGGRAVSLGQEQPLLSQSASASGTPLHSYMWFWGPTFPTRSEVRVAASFGASLIGITSIYPLYAAKIFGVDVQCSATISCSASSNYSVDDISSSLRSSSSAFTSSWQTWLSAAPSVSAISSSSSSDLIAPVPVVVQPVLSHHATYEQVAEASKHLRSQYFGSCTSLAAVIDHDLSINVHEMMSDAQEIPLSTVPGLSALSSVDAKLIAGKVGEIGVLLLNCGFSSLNRSVDLTKYIRVIGMLNVNALFLLSSALSCSPTLVPGAIATAHDHIALTGYNPLRGKNEERWGPRFPDMTDAYCKKLVSHVIAASASALPKIRSLWTNNRAFYSPTELRGYRDVLDVQAVVSSSIPENIVARHMAIDCCALYLISAQSDSCAAAAAASSASVSLSESKQQLRTILQNSFTGLVACFEQMAVGKVATVHHE